MGTLGAKSWKQESKCRELRVDQCGFRAAREAEGSSDSPPRGVPKVRRRTVHFFSLNSAHHSTSNSFGEQIHGWTGWLVNK